MDDKYFEVASERIKNAYVSPCNPVPNVVESPTKEVAPNTLINLFQQK